VTSASGDRLLGDRVVLRPAGSADIPALVPIRETPEVRRYWRGGADLAADIVEGLDDPDSTAYVVELAGRIVGWVQWSAEEDPDYRHASIDIYLDRPCTGGLRTGALRTLVRHLVVDHGHHRIDIDPAVDNAAAIRCYEQVGFRPVGVLRRAERGIDGSWHDCLLMDLLADEVDLTGWGPGAASRSGT
jgi:aminoglycoside 6'-N-acetyltransferase